MPQTAVPGARLERDPRLAACGSSPTPATEQTSSPDGHEPAHALVHLTEVDYDLFRRSIRSRAPSKATTTAGELWLADQPARGPLQPSTNRSALTLGGPCACRSFGPRCSPERSPSRCHHRRRWHEHADRAAWRLPLEIDRLSQKAAQERRPGGARPPCWRPVRSQCMVAAARHAVVPGASPRVHPQRTPHRLRRLVARRAARDLMRIYAARSAIIHA